jgi:hypothetical protein
VRPVGRRELEKHRMSNPVRFVLAVLCVAALFYLVIALARGMSA